MDENKMEPAEIETAQGDDTAFDEGWGDAPAEDDGFELEADDAETPEDQREDEAAGDEAEADTKTGTEPENDSAESKAPAEEKPKNWTLKHNGSETVADEAKMVELAQKGLDYDRVRTERDSYRAEHPKYANYESFLQKLAQSAGTSIDEMIASTSAALLMKEAEARGETLSESEARRQVEAQKAPKESEPENKPDPEAAKRASLQAFAAAYPDVKPVDIPQEVWQESFQTGDLAGAYTRWESRKLKAEIEDLRQNQKNKERSTGSRRSAGATAPKDDFDEAWDSF